MRLRHACLAAFGSLIVHLGGLSAVHAQTLPAARVPTESVDLSTSRTLSPDEVKTLERLLKGDEAERATLAKQLAAGKVAPAVLSALCEKTMDEGSRSAALDALDTISPKLYKPVRTLTSKKKPVDIPIGERVGALNELDKLGSSLSAPALPVVMAVADQTVEQLLNGGDAGLKNGNDTDRGLVFFQYISAYRCALSLTAGSGDRDSRVMPFLVKHTVKFLKAGKPELADQLEQELFGSGLSSLVLQPHHRGAIYGIGTVAFRQPSLRKEAVKAFVALLETNAPVRQTMAAEMLSLCGLEAESALPALKKVRHDVDVAKATIVEIEGRVEADKRAKGGTKLDDVLLLLKSDRNSPAWRHAADLIMTKHPHLLEPFSLLFTDGFLGMSERNVKLVIKAGKSSNLEYYSTRIKLASEVKGDKTELVALLRAKLSECETAAKRSEKQDSVETEWSRLDKYLEHTMLGDTDRASREGFGPVLDYKELVNQLRKQIIALDGEGKEQAAIVNECVKEFKDFITSCRNPGFDPNKKDILSDTDDTPLVALSARLVKRSGASGSQVLDELLKEIDSLFAAEAKLGFRERNEHVYTVSGAVLYAFAKADKAYAKQMAKQVAVHTKAFWKIGLLDNHHELVRVGLVELMVVCGGPDCLATLKDLEERATGETAAMLRKAIQRIDTK